MRTWVILCLCVVYVAAQGVDVPPLPAENVRATQEHLAAVAKATQDHFAAKSNAAPEGAPAPYNHYGYAGVPHVPYGAPHYNPHGFSYNFAS